MSSSSSSSYMQSLSSGSSQGFVSVELDAAGSSSGPISDISAGVMSEEFQLKFRPSGDLLSGFEGSDLCYIPPCYSVLVEKLKRVNFQ